MPDRLFELPELARLYDAFDPDRRDLENYAGILLNLGARSVLDVGCGTGTLALMLARRGMTVIGLDPAQASLDVARSKPGAEKVRWVNDFAEVDAGLRVDAVTMTGNVAQVFLTDESWMSVLQSCRASLRPGGHLIFESRNPAAQAWLRWTREGTYRTARTDDGDVTCFEEVTAVEWPYVSFRTTFLFPWQRVITSTSTLRFRGLDEISKTLQTAGFSTIEKHDAPDRPGLEHVILAVAP